MLGSHARRAWQETADLIGTDTGSLAAPMSDLDDLFSRLNGSAAEFEIDGRSATAALLIWFLRHIKRLDETEAPDAVCDGPGDKGIDGIWVDSVSEEIVLLQAKRRKSLNSTQGDADLQKLVGAARWFSSPPQVEALLAAGPNPELKGLVERNNLVERVEEGFVARCIFVTNSVFDDAGVDYLKAHSVGPPPLEGWGLEELDSYIRYIDRPLYIEDEVELSFPTGASFTLPASEGVEVTVGALPAKQIAALPGIDDRSLFAQNVRLDLGRTRVNKDIGRTLSDADEHARFLTFHNGLTILSRQIEAERDDVFKLKGFSIVNGCQSAVAFRKNESVLTDDLLVPVKLVKVGDAEALADDITYRSNNQNSINLKDLRANDSTQVVLKGEFDERFGGRVQYVIKRGEEVSGDVVIQNDHAAQILIALYNEQPYLAHRKFALFDQEYKSVFHPRISAAHIYLGWLIWDEIQRRLDEIDSSLVAGYALTSFVLVYLVGRIMRETEIGRAVLESPGDYLPDSEASLRAAVGRLVGDILVDFNGFIREQQEEAGYFDYKTQFKSQSAIRAITEDVLRGHQRAVKRDSDVAFHLQDEAPDLTTNETGSPGDST